MTPPAQLAAEYEAGASIKQLAKRHRHSLRRVSRTLKAHGVKIRPPGQPPSQPHPAVSPLVHKLAAVITASDLARAGVSARWWSETKRGTYSPLLHNVESLANAAGYEVVLRRRLR